MSQDKNTPVLPKHDEVRTPMMFCHDPSEWCQLHPEQNTLQDKWMVSAAWVTYKYQAILWLDSNEGGWSCENVLRLGCCDNICWSHQVNKTSGILSVHSASCFLVEERVFPAWACFFQSVLCLCAKPLSLFVQIKQNTNRIFFFNFYFFPTYQFSLKLFWDFFKFHVDPHSNFGARWQEQMLPLSGKADWPHWSDAVIDWARSQWKLTSVWLSWWVQTGQAESAGKAWRSNADKSVCPAALTGKPPLLDPAWREWMSFNGSWFDHLHN